MFHKTLSKRHSSSNERWTVRSFLVAFLVLHLLAAVESSPVRRSQPKTLRLCSRSLSDALYLICRDRGYNEPFSYSGEEEARTSSGPGLVEECCYHTCTYEQLEQYCKPASDEKQSGSQDGIVSVRIVHLPESGESRSSSSAGNEFYKIEKDIVEKSG